MIQTINKSLLEADTKYIAHQCNCITSHSAGIAKAIFDKYPYSNTYIKRKNLKQSDQGTIDVLGNGIDKRHIINMYIQRKPGKPDGYSALDQSKDRLIWLKICLNEISRIENIESIGFPEGVVCRLAGNIWQNVLPILEEFAEKIYKEQNAQTYLYKYKM